jgi:hypothetical protein
VEKIKQPRKPSGRCHADGEQHRAYPDSEMVDGFTPKIFVLEHRKAWPAVPALNMRSAFLKRNQPSIMIVEVIKNFLKLLVACYKPL